MGLRRLDLSIYLAAQILRVMRNEEQRKKIVKRLTERIAELEARAGQTDNELMPDQASIG